MIRSYTFTTTELQLLKKGAVKSRFRPGVERKEKCLWERKITFSIREKERKEKSKILSFKRKKEKRKVKFSI